MNARYNSHAENTHACPTNSKSPRTPKTLSLGVERQILGVKMSTLLIHMWHAHCKRLDAALKPSANERKKTRNKKHETKRFSTSAVYRLRLSETKK